MLKIKHALLLGATLTLVGCASKPDINQQAPGFLPNYSLLKEVPGPQGTKLYVYKNPEVKLGDYHAVIVDPVVLYQTAADKDVTNAQIEQARANINAGIKDIVSKKLALADNPGPGVFRLQVAITGANYQAEGFKPWNVIPISAAIKLASMATDNDSKKPILVVELKFVDSQNGKLLKEVVSTLNGDSFRGKPEDVSNTFAKLANNWVAEALKYSRQQNN